MCTLLHVECVEMGWMLWSIDGEPVCWAPQLIATFCSHMKHMPWCSSMYACKCSSVFICTASVCIILSISDISSISLYTAKYCLVVSEHAWPIVRIFNMNAFKFFPFISSLQLVVQVWCVKMRWNWNALEKEERMRRWTDQNVVKALIIAWHFPSNGLHRHLYVVRWVCTVQSSGWQAPAFTFGWRC